MHEKYAIELANARSLLLALSVSKVFTMKKGICVLVALTISGCAVNSGVVPMGNDTYMVSRQAPSGFHGMGKLKAEAMREAYRQCVKTNKAVEVLETIDARPPYIMGNFPKTEIRFRCVDEDR